MKRHTPITTILLLANLLWWSAPSFATDTQPPAVSISNPTSGTVSGNIQVNVSASDDTNINRVKLFYGGDKISADYSAPYSFTWDTVTYPNGRKKLKAIALALVVSAPFTIPIM